MEERYERIKSFITENGCVLVTPFNVFDKNKMTNKCKFDIIAKCGHESIIQFDMFKCKGSGDVVPDAPKCR